MLQAGEHSKKRLAVVNLPEYWFAVLRGFISGPFFGTTP
jgi:hypothetical protein